MAFNQVNKFDIAYQDKRYGNLVDPYEWNTNFKTIDDNLDDNADKVNENFEMLTDESGANLIGSVDYIGKTETVSTVAAQLEALCSRVFENYTAEQIDSILSGLVGQTVKDVSYDSDTGNFTITYADDTEESRHRTVIETELEKMPVEVEFRVIEDDVFLDLTDSRGITTSVSARSLMDVYTVADTDTIHMSMTDGEITAFIKSGSITDTMLSSELIDRLQSLVDSSYTYSQSATQSASDAAESASSAESYKTVAKASADSAEEYLEAVSVSASEVANNTLITEGYSVGTQHGVEVPATSPYYHNNAKYYKEKAAESAGGDMLKSSYDSMGAGNRVDKAYDSQNLDGHEASYYATADSVNNKYTKPSGGIPSNDLTAEVRASLSKADTALQSHQDISGKENKSNKSTILTSSDTQYPTCKAVKTALATKAVCIEETVELFCDDVDDSDEGFYKVNIFVDIPDTPKNSPIIDIDTAYFGNIIENYDDFKKAEDYWSSVIKAKIENSYLQIISTKRPTINFYIVVKVVY